MRQSLRKLLEARGQPSGRMAASAAEALEVREDGTAIDLMLTDVDMPGLNGIELCREVKANPALRDIPILMLTGLTDEATLQEAFAAGASDYIAKPVRLSELMARVRSALSLKHELDQRKAHERELVALTERLRQVNENLERLSVLDDLTGIANRRFFNVLLGQEWGRAARSATPLALLMIDIDYFKNYNDHYGHLSGDRCLTTVATTLQKLVKRPADCVARYGGEEFVVLLPDTDLPGALVVGENLRAGIAALDLEHSLSAAAGRLTISLGVASTIPKCQTTPEQLLAGADRAVYQAKGEGRNRVAACHAPVEKVTQIAVGE